VNGIDPLGPWPTGPKIVNRERFLDDRGSFEMAFEFQRIRELDPTFPEMLQVNILRGFRGSLRGFHWSPTGENHWKVLTVVNGKVREAIMDVSPGSSTYGLTVHFDLSSEDKVTLVIPPGFAHAVQTITTESTTIYATNVIYANNKEREYSPLSLGLSNIWLEPKILSERDAKADDFPQIPDTLKISLVSKKEHWCD